MNAGRDVERLIADWLVEEAVPRAPDRILESAGWVIDRTKQRRFGAAWREPMLLTTSRLVATIAIIIVAVIGAGWLGRQTAGNGGPNATPTGPTPTVEASPSPSATLSPAAAFQTYRMARDAICKPALQQLTALEATLPPNPTASEQADHLAQIIVLGTTEVEQLAALDPPSAMAEEHAADVIRRRDSLALIGQEVDLLRQGKVAKADAVDEALAGAISSQEEAFQQKYSLADCP